VALRTNLIGSALILAGVIQYGIWYRWSSTRIWRPLDLPISLSAGHIRTPEFEINTRSRYRIDFTAATNFHHEVESPSSPYDPYCLPDLGISWSLSGQGQIVAKGIGQACDTLEYLEVGEGHYTLDLHISRDGSRFDERKPRLVMLEDGGLQSAIADQAAPVYRFWFLTTLGAGLIIYSTLQSRHQKLDARMRAWPLTVPISQLQPAPATAGRPKVRIAHKPFPKEYLVGDRRLTLRHPLSGLPLVPLIIFLTWLPVLVVFLSIRPLVSVGVPIHLLPVHSTAQPVIGIQPLLIRVEPSNAGLPRLYVNYRPVAWDQFETVLRKELALRPHDWPVYLEGDPEMEWRWAVIAIDRIRGLHAEVTLLTTRRHR
jgi:biopolymer transport protein ExbD